MIGRFTCVPVKVERVPPVVAKATVADPLSVKWVTLSTSMELLVSDKDGIRLPNTPFLQGSRPMCHGFLTR